MRTPPAEAPSEGCCSFGGTGEGRVAMRLLVALDQSGRDEAAVLAASRLAGAAGAEVVLCNVVHPWLDTPLSPALSDAGGLEAVVSERRAYLERRAEAFVGLPVTVRVEPLRWP